MLENMNPLNWLYQVRVLLLSTRSGAVWFIQNVDHANLFLKCLKLCLIYNFIQEKYAIIEKYPKCHIY